MWSRVTKRQRRGRTFVIPRLNVLEVYTAAQGSSSVAAGLTLARRQPMARALHEPRLREVEVGRCEDRSSGVGSCIQARLLLG